MTAKQIETLFDKLREDNTEVKRSLISGLVRIERLASKLPYSDGSCLVGGYAVGFYTCMGSLELAEAGATEKDIKFLVEAGAYLALFPSHNGKPTVHFTR